MISHLLIQPAGGFTYIAASNKRFNRTRHQLAFYLQWSVRAG